MKEQELNKLKKVLKPLVKECIKEAIFEEGVLSTLVAEIVSGMGTPIVESAKPEPTFDVMQQERQEKVSQRLQESRQKMLDAIGADAYGGVDIFEGTEPLSSGGSVGAAPSASPLANIDPKDKGVNIDGLMGAFGKKWNALK
tara:strand:+ start:439 stop:864 length:426 start_codon:yes stop_codon:yes gene_type:complete